MKNAWLDEIKINETVDWLSKRMCQWYCGQPVNMESWGEFVMIHLFTFYPDNHRVRDAILSRYTFVYELDEDDKVKCLSLEKLPWFI